LGNLKLDILEKTRFRCGDRDDSRIYHKSQLDNDLRINYKICCHPCHP
jgi:hypothetical protein